MLACCARAAAAVLLAACAAAPQDLPPEVLLLSRIKRHLRAELAHVPNYTCLETISRFQDDPKSTLQSHKGFKKMDTIQLEIVYANGKEWYGSPGARNLSVDDPIAFIGGGMIGTGAFALTMNNIVEAGIFTYRGTETLDGRETVKYDFRVPALFKALLITVVGGSGPAGEDGSIWVDPRSLDLARIESRATEIPDYVPVREATLNVNYARMRIAGSNTLLAQDSDSNMVLDTGVESYNHLEFTHCHSYTTSSEISFGANPEAAAARPVAAPPPPGVGLPVAPFLEVTILLATPISDKDSVGAIIEGKTSSDVVHKGKVIVPSGAAVHGRIRALEYYPDRGVYVVGLEFTDIDVGGQSLPFYGDFLRLDKDPRIDRSFSRRVLVRRGNSVEAATEEATLPDLWGVAQFYVKGANFTLPAGFRTFWRTRGLLRGVDR